MIALVDDEDYDFLNSIHWTAHLNKKAKSYYAEMTREGKTIGMHRLIMGEPKGLLVDHKDRNTLNNQKSNLRIASHSQNSANRKARTIKKTSSFLGVAFEHDRMKWTARIRKDKKGIRLGCFNTEIEAAKAYNDAALKYHGEFANLNKI